jgi:hypothetical protein
MAAAVLWQWSTCRCLLFRCRQSGIRKLLSRRSGHVRPRGAKRWTCMQSRSRGVAAWRSCCPSTYTRMALFLLGYCCTGIRDREELSYLVPSLQPTCRKMGTYAYIVLPFIPNDRSLSSCWGADELSARVEQAAYVHVRMYSIARQRLPRRLADTTPSSLIGKTCDGK